MTKADELLKRWLTNSPENMDICIAKDTQDYLSRKDKLVKDTVWQCIANCNGNNYVIDKGSEVTFIEVAKHFDYDDCTEHVNLNIPRAMRSWYYEEDIPLEQFLACFIPKEDIK